MSSNEPHPAATSPTFELHFTVGTAPVDISGLKAKIYGRLVAIIFASSTIVIYDWTTSTKLMSFERIDCIFQYYSSFLSEDYIFVVQSLDAPANSNPRETPEGLSVYRMPRNTGSGLTKPQPVARFLLPNQNLLPEKNFPENEPRTLITMRDSNSCPVPPSYWLSPSTGSSAAKIFELDQSASTIHLGITRQQPGVEPGFDFDSGMLYISSKTLLNVVTLGQGSETMVVSWEKWRHCATWREPEHKEWMMMTEKICGQRAVAFHNTNPVVLSLYDFAQGPHEKSSLVLENNALNQAFSDATHPYTKSDIDGNVSDLTRHNCRAYYLDDEHLVFDERESYINDGTKKKGIWVYTF